MADKRQIKATAVAINGGTNGLANRINFYNSCMAWLPDGFTLSEPTDREDSITSQIQIASSPHVPDVTMEQDIGVPSWHEENESSEDIPTTAPMDQSTEVGTTTPDIKVNEQQTEIKSTETTENGKIETKTTSTTTSDIPVQVTQTEPDTGFIEKMVETIQATGGKINSAVLAIPAFIGTMLTGVWERMVNGDTKLFLILIVCASAIAVFYIINRIYKNALIDRDKQRAFEAIEKEKQRAFELTMFQAKSASNKETATVQIV